MSPIATWHVSVISVLHIGVKNALRWNDKILLPILLVEDHLRTTARYLWSSWTCISTLNWFKNHDNTLTPVQSVYAIMASLLDRPGRAWPYVTCWVVFWPQINFDSYFIPSKVLTSRNPHPHRWPRNEGHIHRSVVRPHMVPTLG